MTHQKMIIRLSLAGLVALFFIFGNYHLAKFETSDEYLWKYTRVPQYWDAIKNGEWEKTYINDKPGVTVALFSGIGLLSEPHPEKHRIQDKSTTLNNHLAVYDVSKTESINLALRLPVLLFNSFFILFFFWIIKRVTDNEWLALLTSFFIATSPVIIGMSQIINPDAFLWSFSAAAFFSYLALLKTGERKFILLTGILTGMSLLSKYAANILFPIYLFALFSGYFFNFEELSQKNEGKKYFTQGIANFFFIFFISLIVFAIFLPAVFVEPIYLYEGTIGFPGLKMLLGPILVVLGAVLIDAQFFGSKFINISSSFIYRHRQRIFWGVVVFILGIFLTIIANSWLEQKAIPYESIKDMIYAKGKGGFGKITKEFSFPKKLLVEFYPLVHSLGFFPVLILIYQWIRVAIKKESKFSFYPFLIIVISIAYFSAALMSKVLTNTRYSIMLYPLFSFMVAIISFEIVTRIKNRKAKIIFVSALIIFPLISLWNSKPHYLSYTNALLPQKFSVTDSWGYGSYEAAQFLNSLPDAKNIVIWSNRQAVCQFFVGQCMKKEKIDLSVAKPDYFVFSKRGALKNRFVWKDKTLSKNSPDYYYDKLENDYIWSIFINDRPENYVKIIKSEE